jgi:hypothetical protein
MAIRARLERLHHNKQVSQPRLECARSPASDSSILGPCFVFHEEGRFQSLDNSAVSEIVERVKAWYDAFPKQNVPA